VGLQKELNKELNVDVRNKFLQGQVHTEHSWGMLAIFQAKKREK
jgi:hypothetical protein